METKIHRFEFYLRANKKKEIADILKFLEKQKSTYHRMFTETQKDDEQAAKESDHNYKYLRCLEDSFTFLDGSSQKAAQANFPDIVDEIHPHFPFHKTNLE